MKSWKLIIFLMITLLVFISSPGLSEEEKQGQRQREDMMAIKMNEVVVSATRSKISVFDAPQSVTVISREEIMASPFDRWEDIVRSVVGMYNYRHYAVQTHGIASPLKMRCQKTHKSFTVRSPEFFPIKLLCHKIQTTKKC